MMFRYKIRPEPAVYVCRRQSSFGQLRLQAFAPGAVSAPAPGIKVAFGIVFVREEPRTGVHVENAVHTSKNQNVC